MLVKEASYKTDAEAGARGKTSADSVLGTVSAPMEARSQPALPDGEGWWFEPKWDGFRCLLARGATGVQLQSKSGKDLVRYFPEIAAAAKVLAPGPYVLDGELLAARDGAFSFEALQDRLHPAESRIRRRRPKLLPCSRRSTSYRHPKLTSAVSRSSAAGPNWSNFWPGTPTPGSV